MTPADLSPTISDPHVIIATVLATVISVLVTIIDLPTTKGK